MPHHYFPPYQEQQEAWAHGWKEDQNSEHKPRPKVSLLEMLLYILDHRKANEAARNFHIRQAHKSKEMAPVERKARRGEYVAESKWNGQ
ncbi:unnamed protein product [Cylicocyclus nassatus]|uniref:Uncharacterized protein n=1 Tax=Cylicocyclus nassatus TaxID=53992 RepID=A0AA36HEL2_CYLNA|nr:unnamed protein product [Cylicocyclus nassatus]